MKILFLVPSRLQLSDARYRVVPYVESGQQQGLEVSFRTVPGSLLRRYAFFSRLPRADVIVVHRELLSSYELKSVQRLCGKLVYDFSDAVWEGSCIGIGPIKCRAVEAKAKRRFERLCLRADLCIADNRGLADRAAELQDNVVVVPTPLDTDRYVPGRGGNESGTVLVGWLSDRWESTAVHSTMDLLIEHAGAIQFSIVSQTPYTGPGREFVFWSSHSTDRESEQLQNMDIAICPSGENQYSQCCNAIDVVRSMACGAAVVASETSAAADIIDHGIDGFLVRDREDWARHVMRLADDGILRANICDAARRKVVDNYGLDVVARQFWAAIGV